MIRSLILFLFIVSALQSLAQNNNKIDFRFQGDSRRTFVSGKSASIYGVRGGLQFNQKYEVGLGVYSSNLFGLLGRTVQKDYFNNRTNPPSPIPAEIGFHYVSLYGEYTIIENKRIKLTTNTQLGLGRVDINLSDAINGSPRIQERKSLLEYSIKADVKTLSWLRLIGGIGYRHLLNGEDQIKRAFNAPIYITGFSIDFKELFKKRKKR